MTLNWHQRYYNSLDDSGLSVDEYRGHLRFKRDQGMFVQIQIPERTKSTVYEPELSRSRECGWKLAGRATDFIPTKTLAEKCVMQFLDLIARARGGKLR
jgi:hypothetical protein